jgi:predicted acyl esterase
VTYFLDDPFHSLLLAILCRSSLQLVDVYPPSHAYPNGYALNITDGIIRCRYRDSWEHPTLPTSKESFKVIIEPFAICKLFNRGHRLRTLVPLPLPLPLPLRLTSMQPRLPVAS